jgi:hypothetical protein
MGEILLREKRAKDAFFTGAQITRIAISHPGSAPFKLHVQVVVDCWLWQIKENINALPARKASWSIKYQKVIRNRHETCKVKMELMPVSWLR